MRILRLASATMIILVVVVLPSTASATSGTLHVLENTVLTEDHAGPIVIAADSVTLDCAGHVILGDGASPGIYLLRRTGVRVTRCHVIGFSTGILVEFSSGNELTHNRTDGNAGSGFALGDSSNNVVAGNSSSDNAQNGFAVYNSSNFNSFTSNIATGNAGHGLGFNTVRGNTISSNRAAANAAGIGLAFSDENDVLANVSERNTDVGFYLAGSSSNALRGNIARSNGAGINVSGGAYNRFAQNEVSRNDSTGFLLTDGSHDNDVRENASVGNSSSGFLLDGVHSNALIDNSASDNGSGGFTLQSGSSRNRFLGNDARRNLTGLELYGSSENIFTRNRLIDNGRDGCCWGVWVTDASDDNRFVENISKGNAYENFTVAFGSSGNKLLRNISRGSGYEGISLYFGASHNEVRGNVITGNTTSGVLVYESSHNLIADNTVLLNNRSLADPIGGGISVQAGSSFNGILSNLACQNGNADGYDDGTGTGNAWHGNRFCTSNV